MRIINRKRDKTTKGTFVGRPSVLGNPYEIGIHGTRKEVIELYEQWLRRQIEQGNPRVIEALSKLEDDSVLVCYCAPLPCHAQVIERVWREWKESR